MRRLLLVASLITGALCPPGPTAAEPAGRPRSSRGLALTADGSILLVVNPDSGSLTLLDTSDRSVIVEVPVGEDPRCVAVDERGIRAYVTNRGSGTLSVIDLPSRHLIAQVAVGSEPYGVVVAPGGGEAWVAEQGAAQVRILDTGTLATRQVVAVGDRPSGLALADGGATLVVTHLLSGTVSVIDTATRSLVATIPLYADSNLVQSVALSPDGARAYLPHTRSNTANLALTFDTTVFPLVSILDLATRTHLVGQHISLDTVDPPGVGLPVRRRGGPDRHGAVGCQRGQQRPHRARPGDPRRAGPTSRSATTRAPSSSPPTAPPPTSTTRWPGPCRLSTRPRTRSPRK